MTCRWEVADARSAKRNLPRAGRLDKLTQNSAAEAGCPRHFTATNYGEGDGKGAIVQCHLCLTTGPVRWYNRHASVCAGIPPARRERLARREMLVQMKQEDRHEAAVLIQVAAVVVVWLVV